MENKTIVKKRDGRKEPFDIAKVNSILEWATKGIKDVSPSDIIVKAQFDLRDNVTSDQIHKILIDASVNCFTINTPNYQWVASRLINFRLRKLVWGGTNPPKFFAFLTKVISEGMYDSIILEDYSEAEINKLDEYVSHNRDFSFSYAGIKQMCDKYLIQNRKTKQIFETPQFAYMAVAMTIFRDYPKETRLKYVKQAYDNYSRFKINLPTPQMAGIRSPMRAFSSCCLINVGDTMDSILASVTAVGKATAQRYGIGLNVGRIRAIGSEIRKGEVIHTGIIPFLKIFEATTKSCQQNGLRGGGGTVNFPWWHYEVEDILVLKNNGGTEDARVRKLDYVIGTDKLFYSRFLKGENISLFSPHQVPDLYEAFGTSEFEELYLKYEKSTSIMKKTIPAKDLMSLLIKERVETGRIYILHMDHANSHSSWATKIEMTNLCCEILQPTIPISDINDPNGEIGICVLSALNWAEIKDEKDMEQACDIAVRSLEAIIDHQNYFCPAAENFTKNRRSLGIGVTNLAAYLAKNGKKYTDSETPNFVDQMMERQQYYLLKASLQLAKEKGACNKFSETKYSQGILPIDTYKKDLDTVVTRSLSLDWEALRAEIKEHGLRHSTLTAVMPCESSSVISNATNGIEPPRALLSYKKSKAGTVPILVPEYDRYKKFYQTAFEIDNKSLLNIAGAISKYLDMSISTNVYYDYNNYPDGKLPDLEVIKDILYSYKLGVPALYYNNTNDDQNELGDGCESGACAI